MPTEQDEPLPNGRRPFNITEIYYWARGQSELFALIAAGAKQYVDANDEKDQEIKKLRMEISNRDRDINEYRSREAERLNLVLKNSPDEKPIQQPGAPYVYEISAWSDSIMHTTPVDPGIEK